MSPAEPLIRNISDTARWVAVYRATETERPDALFRDPFARKLAGKRGEEIAAGLANRPIDWSFTIRTYLFDAFIADHVRAGGDMIINLAAGLDARPYRMDVPPSLRWVEIDLPEILDYKEEVLAGEKPRCDLRRLRVDLADPKARRPVFAELGGSAKNALVLSEGLISYLTEEQVGSLGEDLAAPSGIKRWATDLMSRRLRLILMEEIGSKLNEARAPLVFSPEKGPDFFADHRWRPIDVRSMLQWAGKKKRLKGWLRFGAMLPDSRGKNPNTPWGGVILMEKMAGGAA
ncbi:MAG: class I SAM-dependent methyltransferase [Candidatus Eiseniibacteriota bacterium]